VENWQVYAAVTGSAVAMATNASASIIYSGILNQKVAVKSAQTGSPGQLMTTAIKLKSGAGATIQVGFHAVAAQGNSGPSFKFGAAALKGSQVDFLLKSSFVKRLSSGAKISGGTHTAQGHNGFVKGNQVTAQSVADRSIRYARRQSFGWSRTEGFAGFSFTTVTDHQKDFGWVRLEFTVGSNALINGLTVIDWGYQNNGAAITAGNEGVISAPEPPTADLALLALGAAGVTALRRRRKASA
jgi:MYXO-CTERM domain-containing protein